MSEEPEVLTPEMAKAEADAMNADRDGPLHDKGHPKHLAAMERLTELLIAQDAPAVEGQPDLEAQMADAMQPVETPEGYSFDAFNRPEGSEWDEGQEQMFRGFFHAAELSQPEADQLMVIASSNTPVDAQHTESVLQSRYRGDDEAMQKDIALARAAIHKAGGEPLVNWLNETGLGDHIAFFDMALRKAKQWGLEA